jgi:hypothetical protein
MAYQDKKADLTSVSDLSLPMMPWVFAISNAVSCRYLPLFSPISSAAISFTNNLLVFTLQVIKTQLPHEILRRIHA